LPPERKGAGTNRGKGRRFARRIKDDSSAGVEKRGKSARAGKDLNLSARAAVPGKKIIQRKESDHSSFLKTHQGKKKLRQTSGESREARRGKGRVFSRRV